MKVKFDRNYKKDLTIYEVEQAKRIIEEEKDDAMTAKDMLEYAVNERLKKGIDYCAKVITATATIRRNIRIWNAYHDDSQELDIWIEGLAKTGDGYIEIGAYATDIWQTGAVDYRSHIYSKYYTHAE